MPKFKKGQKVIWFGIDNESILMEPVVIAGHKAKNKTYHLLTNQDKEEYECGGWIASNIPEKEIMSIEEALIKLRAFFDDAKFTKEEIRASYQ